MTDVQGNTVLLYSNDLTAIFNNVADDLRSAISQAVGIPVSNIILSATYNHSAPDMEFTNESIIVTYNQDVEGWTVEAAHCLRNAPLLL